MRVLLVEILRLVPKRAATRVLGLVARVPVPRRFRRAIWGAFARRYGADVSEADRGLDEFPTFQDFFARRLRAGARPVADARVVSPVDGTVVSSGDIADGRLMQVKGRDYALADLLGDHAEAAALTGGRYVTIYLHPRNYHRIHAPIDGRVIARRHIRGRLWPVGAEATAKVPRLFATNERMVTAIEGPAGRVAVVKVAAFGVGTVRGSCEPGRIVRRGDEIATFLMGSTVVLVAAPGAALAPAPAGREVRVGESLCPSGEGAADMPEVASASG